MEDSAMLMNAELYTALKEAGASEEAARAAASSVAAYDARFASVDRDLTVLKWMVGTNVAFTIAVLYRVLFPSG
jgi:hypothetical protein